MLVDFDPVFKQSVVTVTILWHMDMKLDVKISKEIKVQLNSLKTRSDCLNSRNVTYFRVNMWMGFSRKRDLIKILKT